MTREEASAAGLKRYQGRPCINGHQGERYVHSDACCECSMESVRRSRERGPRQNAPARLAAVVLGPITGGCRFPMWGNDEAPTHEYCGAKRREGSSYCPAHHARTHVPAKKESAA